MSTTINQAESVEETSSPNSAVPESGGIRRVLRRVRRWIRNILLSLLVLLILAVLAGQVQQARLARAFPPPGEFVQVGDHRLHVMRSGSGPTVVFENGPGGIGLDWSLVASEAAGFASTVAYDRAGLGWSEPAEGPRDIATLVDELKTMLVESGANPPYVLVGHSYGGLIVRAYAYTYPEDVAGLVLVDAAHEDQFEIYPQEYAAKGENMGEMMARLRLVFRLANGSGIPALFNAAAPIADKLPGEIGAARAAVGLMDSSQAVATTDEMAALLASFDHVRSIRGPLGDIPVRIITHGRAPGAEAGIPPGLEAEVEVAWQEMQRDLLTISTDSSLEVASRSGHDIHVEQPEVVIDAIRDILNG